jgi:signal transduction histidine kinase
MLSDKIPFLIEYERLRSVFLHAPLTLSVTVINAVVVALVLAPIDGIGRSTSWVAAIMAVSAARWIGSRAYLQSQFDGERLRRLALFSILGSLATGILWGIGATVLFPASELYQLFLALVIAGMCAGAITVNAAHMPTVAAFILPASLPLAASFLAQGPAGRVSALMVVIFSSALSVIGLAAHRTFGVRIRLQIALDQERRSLGQANERLLAEMAQRQIAEATLHQVQKMEAIGHLTGGIAHDFNNLLQVMIGNLDLIQRAAADDPRIVKYAVAAEQAALRGSELTSGLLAFARRQTLQAVPVNINALLREFEPILMRTLGAMIRFDITLAPELPRCVADPAHFQSAVLNLVINARDAMPDGGVLSLSTRVGTLCAEDLAGNADASPGAFVGVSVRDTGVGMSAEVLARVFEPFFTTKEAGKGTGLGLSQVYGFARQSGGHIGLASTSNEGTEATLWLPVATAEAENSQAMFQDGAERSPAGRSGDPVPALR